MNEFANAPEWLTRPMTLGEILTRVRQIFVAQLRLFLKLGIVPAVAMVVLYALVWGGMYAEGMLKTPQPVLPTAKVLELIGWMLVGSVPFMLAYVLYEGATTLAALQANRGGASSFEKSYRAAWQNFGRLVGLMLLRMLYVAFPFLVIAAVVMTAIGVSAGSGGLRNNPGALAMWMPALFLSYLLGLAWAIWMGLRLMMALPVLLVENVSVTEALRRSAKLSVGAKGREFVVMLVLYLCSMVGIFVLELVAAILAGLAVFIGVVMHMPPPVALAMGVPAAVLLLFGFLLALTLQWASMAIACAVIYDDQNFRERGVTALTGETA